jgi:Nitrogen regulatory protein P-II
MATVPLRLVTIVAEAVLEDSLIGLVKEVGATGYTLSSARGEGSRGRRLGEIPGDNVRLEVLVGAAVAEALLELLAARFFADYAAVAWITEVHVRRGEKYC